MNCRRFEKWFALDVEGDLPARKRRAVAEHMEGCERCRDFAARLEASQRAVRELADETVEEEVLREIRARVLANVAERERPKRSWLFAYAAVAASLAILAAVFLVSRHVPRERAGHARPLQKAASAPDVVPKPTARRVVRKRPAAPKRRPEPLLVKLETSDPNVVIYWIVESGE